MTIKIGLKKRCKPLYNQNIVEYCVISKIPINTQQIGYLPGIYGYLPKISTRIVFLGKLPITTLDSHKIAYISNYSVPKSYNTKWITL